MKQNGYDPTVVDSFQRSLIEQSTGARLKDADPEELDFIISKSKEAGNNLFKEKKHRGALVIMMVFVVFGYGEHVDQLSRVCRCDKDV